MGVVRLVLLKKDVTNKELNAWVEISALLAHTSAMLHATVLGTLEIVTDLVNQLYGGPG